MSHHCAPNHLTVCMERRRLIFLVHHDVTGFYGVRDQMVVFLYCVLEVLICEGWAGVLLGVKRWRVGEELKSCCSPVLRMSANGGEAGWLEVEVGWKLGGLKGKPVDYNRLWTVAFWGKIRKTCQLITSVLFPVWHFDLPPPFLWNGAEEEKKPTIVVEMSFIILLFRKWIQKKQSSVIALLKSYQV